MRLRMLDVVTFALAATALGCAPEHQGALREDKMLSIGYPGAFVRPNGHVALATTFDLPTRETNFLNAGDDGRDADLDRPVRKDSYAIKPHVQIFPGEKSSFFFGAGAVLQSSRYTYLERQSNFTLDAPAYARVEYASQSTYAALPLGWQPIWDNGVTFGSSIEPRFYMSQRTSMTKDGTGEGVDAAARDKTLREIDRSERRFDVTFGTFVGFAF
jgi:hypothetical protein